MDGRALNGPIGIPLGVHAVLVTFCCSADGSSPFYLAADVKWKVWGNEENMKVGLR